MRDFPYGVAPPRAVLALLKWPPTGPGGWSSAPCNPRAVGATGPAGPHLHSYRTGAAAAADSARRPEPAAPGQAAAAYETLDAGPGLPARRRPRPPWVQLLDRRSSARRHPQQR